MTQLDWWKVRLKTLESDLKDSTDPKVLARWPNLKSQGLIDQTRIQIDDAKKMIAILEAHDAALDQK